jgi:signal transduction histidine kinase
MESLMLKLRSMILSDVKHNREEYLAAVPVATPIVILLWPLFGYLWMSFHLFESIGLRYSLSVIYLVVGGSLYIMKRVTTAWHFSWVILNAASLWLFPWYMYIQSDRSLVWALSLMFFGLTYAISVRGLDLLFGLMLSFALMVFVFRNSLTTGDLVPFIVQISITLIAYLGLLILRKQRLQLQESTSELAQANEILRSNEKFKDEFVARVAHELRNPLSVITSYVWDIADDTSMPQIVHKKMKYMQQAVGSLDRMILELMELQRFRLGLITLNIENHSIESYANFILTSMASIAKARDITFTVSVTGLKHARFDKVRMNHVMFNLIDNAFKFVHPKRGAVLVDFYGRDGKFMIRVRDNGIGIAKENLDRIFTRYFQEKRDSAGTGIGLSLVREVVEAHGGRVQALSELNVGTQFDLMIPMEINTQRGK